MASFWSFYVGTIVPASTVIPIGIGIRYWAVSDRPVRLITIYLSISLLINALASVLASHQTNNLPLLHLDTLLEGVLMFWFFSEVLLAEKVRRFCRILCFIFPFLCLAELIFIHSIYQFNSYSRPLESFTIAMLSIYYLSEQLGRERRTPLAAAIFLIVIGALLYFTASFFMFLFSNLVSAHVAPPIKKAMWNLHATFVLGMYVLMAAGLLKLKELNGKSLKLKA